MKFILLPFDEIYFSWLFHAVWITPVKEVQAWQNSNLIFLSQNIFKHQISIQCLERLQREIWETEI